MSYSNTFWNVWKSDKTADEYVIEIQNLKQENKQLKEQLENKIDLYEDTISYQLGFDKGKEYLQQRIDKTIEYIKDYIEYYSLHIQNDEIEKLYYERLEELLSILGDNEWIKLNTKNMNITGENNE